MNGVKKVCNVLGIIVAWLLSIALVILLVVSPIIFSALSLLDAETLTKAFANSITQEVPSPSAEKAPHDEGVQLIQLSNVSQEAAPDNDLAGMIDISQFGDLSGLLGDDISQDTLNEILASDVAKEIIQAYTDDIANVFVGDGGELQFDGEKLKKIINDNIDEVVDILQKAVPKLKDTDKATLKEDIRKIIDENADEIMQSLPKPEDIKQQIVETSPELEAALEILAQKDTIKLTIIGVIVALSVLIFLCRLCGFRGLRWLATDLFVAGGMGLFTCAGLSLGASMLEGTMASEPMISGLVGTFLGTFTTGMWIRVGVLLLAAVVLLVGYILINKLRTKKAAAPEIAMPKESVAQETAVPEE